MLFTDSVHKKKLEIKATSNLKVQQVLDSIGLDNVGIYLRVGPFSSDIGIVYLHPSKGTHWVLYNHECYFDSYVCTPPQQQSKFIIKRNGFCLYSEYQIQKNDSFNASYCLYIFYMTKVLCIAFRYVALNLYYQRFS